MPTDDPDIAAAARRAVERSEALSRYNEAAGRDGRERLIHALMDRHPEMSRHVAERYADQEPPAMGGRHDGRG